MASQAFTIELFSDTLSITSESLEPAAQLFSEHYGIWKNQRRVVMRVQAVRRMLMPEGADVLYARAVNIEGQLIGNAFACCWRDHEGRNILWITQLVVGKGYREQGVATSLIRSFREHQVKSKAGYLGVLSSHPAAIRAVLRACDKSLAEIDLDLIKARAAETIALSPIDYVRTAKLNGRLFTDGDAITDSVSCAFTNFFVDHAEPDEALRRTEADNAWPLGKLPEGHEFLLLVASYRT